LFIFYYLVSKQASQCDIVIVICMPLNWCNFCGCFTGPLTTNRHNYTSANIEAATINFVGGLHITCSAILFTVYVQRLCTITLLAVQYIEHPATI